MTVSGDQLPVASEHVPPLPSIDITISGDALLAIRALMPRVAGANTEKDLVLRAVSVLHQADGRRIQFVDKNDHESELDPIWN